MNDEADHDLATDQRGFTAGDVHAFERLFRRYQADVSFWALRLVRDRAAAEDITAEAFWRAWRSRTRYDPARPFRPWVRRIAVNLAIGHLQHAQPSTELPVSLAAPAAGDGVLTAETRRHIVEAFEALPAKLRAAATLALVEERAHAEIAEVLGISLSAVKARVSRAARVLRRRLEKRGIRP